MSRSTLASVIPENFDISANAEHEGKTEIDFRTPGTYSVNSRYRLLCSTIGISPRGLALSVMIKPKPRDKIDAVFETIGCVQGHVSEIIEVGFILTVDPTIHRTLCEQIAFLAIPTSNDADRRHFRIEPRNPETMIKIGTNIFPANIVDFSISGACIETDASLSLKEKIVFPRSTKAKVVRLLGNRRFGVEFERQFASHEFTRTTRL